mmetsp:Transcript_34880/g.104339  ORF Transcript_34880/g.104339 Transcript_34880/m.104339 type:complete len:402 (+) Transcript_34880:72-1277(+)
MPKTVVSPRRFLKRRDRSAPPSPSSWRIGPGDAAVAGRGEPAMRAGLAALAAVFASFGAGSSSSPLSTAKVGQRRAGWTRSRGPESEAAGVEAGKAAAVTARGAAVQASSPASESLSTTLGRLPSESDSSSSTRAPGIPPLWPACPALAASAAAASGENLRTVRTKTGHSVRCPHCGHEAGCLGISCVPLGPMKAWAAQLTWNGCWQPGQATRRSWERKASLQATHAAPMIGWCATIISSAQTCSRSSKLPCPTLMCLGKRFTAGSLGRICQYAPESRTWTRKGMPQYGLVCSISSSTCTLFLAPSTARWRPRAVFWQKPRCSTEPRTCLQMEGCCQAYSNCSAAILLGKPHTQSTIFHGLQRFVFHAPIVSSPLCCRRRRRGSTVKPMYVCRSCFSDCSR